MTLTHFAIIAVCAYLLGSLSFAIIVSKVTLGKDIRNYGSGNAGLTNAYRTMGAKKTLFVLLGDIAKGAAAVSVGWALGGPVGKLTAGIFVILGHMFILSVVLTKWISLGSILGAVSFPITTWLFYRDPVLTAMAFGMTAAVIFMHRSNIGRILHGTENKFSFKSKKTIEASPDGEEK